MDKLTHLDKDGKAVMVDISDKDVTSRYAKAYGNISMRSDVIDMIASGKMPKGDVFAAAKIAGIMAAKKTSDLIPLCHPLLLNKIDISFDVCSDRIEAVCEVRLSGKTGAEMEALTGVSVALLTIYDMCKAADRSMVISDIRLEEKDGGKTGHYIRQ